uniref:Fibronectin type-III domain-containing protein n=1 Tax=Timema genevievae TaxID=629358 RepID=A0A7R9K359_TIMGE|nr:unnamed protein product [Timema genevievae]
MGDFRLTGLDKFAQYSIILEAFNTKGDGPPSDQIIAQTLEDVPSAAPMALSCSALTSQNLQVMWHPPPTHLTHGNIQAYKLYYEPTEEWYVHPTEIRTSISPSSAVEHNRTSALTNYATEAETDVRETKVTTALTSVLHGLLPFTNYSLQILATTKAGDGVLSPVTYCMTEEAVPEAPERVKAVVVSEDTVVVSWLPPRRPNGLLTKYTVYIRVMEQGQEMKVIKGTLPAQHTHYDAVGLSTKETYEAWVTATAIVSFGQMLVVAWKVNVKMICLCVGIPRPIAEWKLGDQKLHSQPSYGPMWENARSDPELELARSGNARLALDLPQFWILVPPTAPLLLATTITLNSVQLQWKQGDNGGAAVKGFLLAYRREFGEWEEISVERRATTYLLDGLRCGTRYQFRMAAFNKIGSGSASSLEVARTKGGKPIAPLSARFLKINSTSVHLILSAWQDADCPILYFVVESRRDGPTNENEWRLVSNNILPQQRFPLVDLTPGTRYFLRVTGHNHAGSTLAEYDFTTLSPNTELADMHLVYGEAYTGSRSAEALHRLRFRITPKCTDGQPLPDTGVTNLPEEIPFYLDSHVIVPKPIQEDLCLHESQTTAVLDNKQNLEQREQYYATVRKPLHSPNRDVSGLERIPEYSEDIYPYATFHLAEQESMASNPQLHSTFGYESRNSDTLQVKQCDTDQYSKVRGTRSRRKSKSFKSESEEYDSLGSDSDTEQGTSSRTESSNHLDDPGSGAGTSRAGVHRPGHHNSLSRTHESSTSTEPSPISEKKHFSRHSKISGNVSIRVNPPVRLTQTEETTFILNHKLNPPCGFSDGLEPSEAECDLDSMKRLRLAINVFAPSSDNQDFTIAV